MLRIVCIGLILFYYSLKWPFSSRRETWWVLHNSKKCKKSGKTLIFLLNGQNPLFQSFSTFGWYDWSYNFILKFTRFIFQLKQKLIWVFYDQNPISSTFFCRWNPRNLLSAHNRKALKPQFLKKAIDNASTFCLKCEPYC